MTVKGAGAILKAAGLKRAVQLCLASNVRSTKARTYTCNSRMTRAGQSAFPALAI